ncbi:MULTISPECIES: winged helix-turn-helix domain-containing protein [Metallosphaera]|uniref:Transcriptional regulator, ArsR family n=3 Tax=Metallosphaera TaxID=41980 RepID=A4YIE1_METS5|nr:MULTISPECIES: helix-turn-helix domain-containing protein [Metallosphaera]ABP96193.1 transcriptional regulator, ArsR family [Metallosphaera sedula DSM 5348]AIM28176.1 transcriptional regulator, ArsR family [Metallosphaera sedula]AKV74993.1 ArsR family transcriptional regulator [Metallosphaera sedula]AKV77231.1 ArsR family transcriptional regulator [Metallosphaera sedula]AKV79481.1 ArsR family transcriptional regulator [Metallosphaera sedula]
MESLTGTRRKIYYYLVKQKDPVPLRKIQRELKLSSPSLALYHLKKLEENGLVKETDDGYVVTKLILGDFVKLMNVLIPRSAFMASFLIASLILLWVINMINPYSVTLFSSIVIAIPAGIFIIDVVRKYNEIR